MGNAPGRGPYLPGQGPGTNPLVTIGLNGTIGNTTLGVASDSGGLSWGQTTQIGIGVSVEICVKTPPPPENECKLPKWPRIPDSVSTGFSRNLGITVSKYSYCVDIGPSKGLPAGANWDLGN